MYSVADWSGGSIGGPHYDSAGFEGAFPVGSMMPRDAIVVLPVWCPAYLHRERANGFYLRSCKII